MSHEIEHIKEEVEIIKKNQIEALELLEGLSGRPEPAEERSREFESWFVKMIKLRPVSR